MLAISSQSTIYVQVPVNNTEGTDPTSDTVAFAFVGPYATTPQAGENPPTSSTVWYTGSWGPDDGAPWTARILVGPVGGVTALGVGSYQVWVKVSASPETPVLWSGPMQVS